MKTRFISTRFLHNYLKVKVDKKLYSCRLSSKTVPVLASLYQSLISAFHNLPSPDYPAGFSVDASQASLAFLSCCQRKTTTYIVIDLGQDTQNYHCSMVNLASCAKWYLNVMVVLSIWAPYVSHVCWMLIKTTQ